MVLRTIETFEVRNAAPQRPTIADRLAKATTRSDLLDLLETEVQAKARKSPWIRDTRESYSVVRIKEEALRRGIDPDAVESLISRSWLEERTEVDDFNE